MNYTSLLCSVSSHITVNDTEGVSRRIFMSLGLKHCTSVSNQLSQAFECFINMAGKAFNLLMFIIFSEKNMKYEKQHENLNKHRAWK